MSQYRTLVNMGADRPGSLASQQLAERVNTMQSVRRRCNVSFKLLIRIWASQRRHVVAVFVQNLRPRSQTQASRLTCFLAFNPILICSRLNLP